MRAAASLCTVTVETVTVERLRVPQTFGRQYHTMQQLRVSRHSRCGARAQEVCGKDHVVPLHSNVVCESVVMPVDGYYFCSMSTMSRKASAT